MDSDAKRELIGLSATEAVARLASGEITPLDLIDAAEWRIGEVEPALNALPTTCFDRAREHAKRLMARSDGNRLHRGWLGGLPVAIKDLTDVAGVRTTYGSPIFAEHVPDVSHRLITRIEQAGGIVIAKSNTPEFGAGGSTFNEVFGRTSNPWNTALTSGGSTGGGAAALAAGEVWLAHGTDHAGSLRRPATYCSVVGLRPSAGRVTRGSSTSPFSPDSVHGPMARTVEDVALFLDAMSGLCPYDPLTFDAPALSFVDALHQSEPPARIAFTADFGGAVLVERETKDICEQAARRFADLGTTVEEATFEVGDIEDAFLALRGHYYLVNRGLLVAQHRDRIKPDIVWNTELGRTQSPDVLANAERTRAKLVERAAAFFERYDILVTPGASAPAFDVNLRMPDTIDGKPLENYLGASLITGLVSMIGLPALSVPCGFDRFGRPVGLQLVGRHRGESQLLSAAHRLMQQTHWDRHVPIDPRHGTVPDTSTPT
jgi:amidase